ncbi:MAG: recombinase family protein [Firmicutes bacterium]|nr:recombinase family protein [Bacillota bacterium]
MNFDSSILKKLLSIYSPHEIAKYIRLSLADEYNQNDESESIANQRRLLNEFIDRNGNNGEKCKEFIDDGCSGTNFARPGWQKLMSETESGKIKVIITKNLSRLGRSNFECGYFIDYYFPTNNIRYIAVQEQIDTANQENSNNEYAALNNFINEKYSRDLSKNIKKVYKIKQYAGEYMGGNPIYGYAKDPNDKHRLIIDEEAAKIVRRIFSLYLEHQSQNKIRTIFSNEMIPIPEVYKKTRRGLKVKHPYEWNYKTIREILRNEMYIGNMVQNVFSKKSFREKKMTKNKKEEWIIVEKTHEPIIDKETFYQVQELLNANYRQPVKPYPHKFAGLLYCHECGHKIGIGNVKRNRDESKQYFYTYCNYYRKNRACSSHSLNYNNLEANLLNIIDNLCKKYIKQLDYDILVNEKKLCLNTYSDTLKKRINKIHIDLKEIDLKIEKIYMDRLNDIISVNTYQKMNEKLELKKAELVKEINELQKVFDNYREDNFEEKVLETTKIVKEYVKARKNEKRDLLIKLVDRIEIYQDKKIDVHFKFKSLS